MNQGSHFSDKSLISDINICHNSSSFFSNKTKFNSKSPENRERGGFNSNASSFFQNKAEHMYFETRPRRNEFSRDTNWMTSIQQLSYQEPIDQTKLGEKIEKDVYELIDNDESNNYDPIEEKRYSQTTLNSKKIRDMMSFSTQPTEKQSFNYSKKTMDCDKKVKDLFLQESMFCESPELEKAFGVKNYNKTFNFQEEMRKEKDKKGFNPFTNEKEKIEIKGEYKIFGDMD